MWQWPTVGGIGSHGSTVYRMAEPNEATVREALSVWLRDCASRVPGENTELTDVSDRCKK